MLDKENTKGKYAARVLNLSGRIFRMSCGSGRSRAGGLISLMGVGGVGVGRRTVHVSISWFLLIR